MKTKLPLYIATLIPIGIATFAHGYTCDDTVACNTSGLTEIERIDAECPTATGCTNGVSTCYRVTADNGSVVGMVRVVGASACPTGYNLQTGPVYSRYCGGMALDMITCGRNNATCTSDTKWIPGNPGYEKMETRVLQGVNCVVTSTEYRCAAGYYGISYNGTTGCTRCPSSGGVYGVSEADSPNITYCYMPKGTVFSDSTGTGEYTNDCAWED